MLKFVAPALLVSTVLAGCAPKLTPMPRPPEKPNVSMPAEQRLSTSRGDSPEKMSSVVATSRAFLKQRLDNHREYTVTTGDGSWVGTRWEYEVDVKDGDVVARRYQRWDRDGAKEESWQELGADVGTHKRGASRTIEEMYDHCINEVLTKSEDDHHLYVSIGKEGELNSCVFVPKTCMDDCSSGIGIKAVVLR